MENEQAQNTHHPEPVIRDPLLLWALVVYPSFGVDDPELTYRVH